MLLERPELTLELLAVMVERAGGSVVIEPGEGAAIVPFDLLSRCDHDGRHYLILEARLSPERLALVEGSPPAGRA